MSQPWRFATATRAGNRRVAAVLAAGLTLAGAVVIVPASAGAQARPGDAKAAWTVLVYDDADTENIESDLLRDVEALAGVGSGPDLNVVALVDRVPGQDDGPLLNIPNFDTAKLLEVGRGGLTELADVGEVDMGNGEVLAWFLTTAMQEYPAEHYAVFIDDHGGGVLGSSWDVSTQQAGGGMSNLTLDDVTGALDVALETTGEDRVDLFGYLACLMATYDAAAELGAYADFMAASEEVTFGPQADLGGMLAAIAADPQGVTGATLGEHLVEVTDGLTGFAGRTQSVVDLRAMPRVTQALESFVTTAGPQLAAVGPAIARAHAEALHFGANVDPAGDFFLYDLGDLLARIEGLPPDVATARDALYEAVDTAVIANATGPGSIGAIGLSIFFPPTAGNYPRVYDQLATLPSWAAFVQDYHEVSGVVPGFVPVPPEFQSPTLDVEMRPEGVLASGDLVPGSERRVFTADLYVGATTPIGSVVYYGSLPASVGSGRSEGVAAGWNLEYVEVADMDSRAPVTVFLRPAAGGLRATIPILYRTDDGTETEAELSTLIDRDGTVGRPVILQRSDGRVANLTPQPGATFTPAMLEVPPGGRPRLNTLPGTPTFDTVDFTLSTTRIAPGTPLTLTVEVQDLDGRGAAATGTAVAP